MRDTVKTRYDEIFNEEAMHTLAMDERARRWFFAVGFQEGMREAARLLESDWYKTQADCAKAISDKATRI